MKIIKKLLCLTIAVSTLTGCQSKETLTKEEAIDFVLQHANINEEDISINSISLDLDDKEYSISFSSASSLYEYEINAYNGDVKEYEISALPVSQNQTTTQENDEVIDTSVTASEAKAIAFKHAGVSESNATNVSVEIDEENNSLVYEVEFKYGIIEYDYEILISDGSIVSFNMGS